MDKIKPCPFCADVGYLAEIDGYRPSSPRTYKVWCLAADCCVESQEYNTPAEAITAWNKRPAEDALQKRVTELEKFITVAKIRGDWWVQPIVEDAIEQV